MNKLNGKRINPIVYVVFALMPILSNACSGDSPIEGFDLTDVTDRGEIRNTVLDTLQLEMSFDNELAPTGHAVLLSLGAFDNVTTKILLRFATLPDSLVISSAKVILHPHAVIGRSKGSFTATARQVTTDWDESTVTSESFDESQATTVVGMAEIFSTIGNATSKDSSVVIPIDPALVNAWIDSSVANQGILIDFSRELFIEEFFSKDNSTQRPQLQLQYMVEDTLQTNSFVATADAFLFKRTSPLPSGPIYVANGLNRRSILKFKLSEIPREATVSKAMLDLNIQLGNTLLTGDGLKIQVVPLLSEFVSPDSFKTDASFVLERDVSASDGSIQMDIRSLLQTWVSQTRENFGFVIRSRNPDRDVSRIAFFSTEIDTSLAPKVAVDFTIPPQGK
ncbi:MAG: DNRLRE domain-containing protein [bacterium]